MWPRNARHNAYTGAQLRRGPKPSKTFRLCSQGGRETRTYHRNRRSVGERDQRRRRLRRHRFARDLYRLQALHRPRGFRSNSRRVARLQPTTRGSAAQLLGLPGNVDGWAPRLRSSTRLQAGSSIASTHATYTSCAAQKMMAQRCTSVSPSTVPRLATITAPTSAPTGMASCLSKGCTSSFGRAARSDHHTFEIEFLDPGVHAHSFTFG